jgi:hypothetical protein
MKLTFCWITLLALTQLYPLFGEPDDQTLAGLTAVQVLVEGLPPGAAKLGLTKEVVQTDVELKLRLAGMRVLTASFEALYVNVNATTDGRAASISVEVLQGARLARDPNIMTSAAVTWHVSQIEENPTGQSIRDVIKDLVDSFLNAWLSVNPKK